MKLLLLALLLLSSCGIRASLLSDARGAVWVTDDKSGKIYYCVPPLPSQGLQAPQCVEADRVKKIPEGIDLTPTTQPTGRE